MIFLYVFIIGHVTCDIRRYDTGYDADFRVINKGRLYNSLMWFENNDLGECMLNCIRHLNCITFNYNPDTKQCELADEEFDEYEADTVEPGWFNYGTPQKVDGGLSDWVNGSCNAACGGGVQYQRRSCTNPEPKFGGEPCSGETSRTIECNTHPCPIDGGFSGWVNGLCSTTCGIGQLIQTRKCTSPVPEHGGADCTGVKTRTVSCNDTQPCPPINIAVGKPATMVGASPTDAGYANDGEESTFMYTSKSGASWWAVDLQQIREIKYMFLLARRTDPNNNKKLFVETRRTEIEAWKACKSFGDIITRGNKFTCDDAKTNARYVKIQALEYCHVYLFEVEVYADP